MLILLTVLFLILTLLCLCKCEEFAILTGILFLFSLGSLVIVGCYVSESRTFDEKIAMYTEENANIEADINALVEQYMDYESDTYGELKGENGITLVSLYPELKADTLVNKQIEVYIANNEKIKELKAKKINLTVYKWWLYFGK
jgi:hypothetical protein